MNEMFERAVDTLEVLMCKLGLKDQFERVVEQYEEERKESLRKTLIKKLLRCKIMYASLSKIQVIFKLIISRELCEDTIIKLEV